MRIWLKQWIKPPKTMNHDHFRREPNMIFHPIDMDTWSRKPYFDHYLNNV